MALTPLHSYWLCVELEAHEKSAVLNFHNKSKLKDGTKYLKWKEFDVEA